MDRPSADRTLAVAVYDLRDAVARYPLWVHQGWIDVVQRYRRTIIGPFWHTLSLGFFIVAMGTIWAVILKVDAYSYFRYVTINLVIWTLISNFINEGTTILINGQSTALSMRFPFVAFALAHVWRGLLMFLHHMILYVLVVVGTQLIPTPATALAIPALILILLNGVWMSLLIGIGCLKFRDMAPAVASAMQVLIFITPIFWPTTMLGPRLEFVAQFNPFYHLVLILREPLLGVAPPLASWIWSLGFLAVGSVITFWIYGRYRDRFAYWY
jgi:ABC-type polysaccharide/polyol phosphate export permease